MESDNKQLRLYDKTGKFCRMSVDEVIAREFNHWKSWRCSAGIRSLYIDYNRNIFICNTASAKAIEGKWGDEWEDWLDVRRGELGRDIFKEEHEPCREEWRKIILNDTCDYSDSDGYVGKVGGEINFPFGWVDCPHESCPCGADVIVSKKSNKKIEYLSVTKHGYEGQLQTKDDWALNDIIHPVALEMDFPIPYQILWDLTRRCNYSCSYCWPFVHNKTDKFISGKEILAACEKFIYEWAEGKEIRFNFGGGEPTLHPDFLEVLTYLKQHKQWVLVTSNGSRSPDFWRKAVRCIKSINLSAHFESIDKDRFIENLNIIFDWHDIHKDDHWIEVKLMAPPGRVDEAVEFANRIKSLNRIDKPGANGRTKGICSLVPIRSIGDSGRLVKYEEDELCQFRNQ